MDAPGSVLVVGASAGGLATVEALRRKGYRNPITVVGDEPHLPYDRPPLSKQVLGGKWEADRAQLRSSDALSALDAEFVLADPAVEIDVAQRTVRTSSGRALEADAVVVATGARPRALPAQEDLAGVHVLRSLDDVRALQESLRTSSRLAVVGDGVLGAEIAATARGMGLAVSMAGPQRAPLASQIGTHVAGKLGELHTERGVELRLGTGVSGLIGRAGHVTAVRLDNGEELAADAVVIAIGAIPATEWLTGSGLRLDDGVVCDSRCRAAESIYAVGDVARWYHESLDSLVRWENRTNATEQAGLVADNVLGADRAYRPVPYFWTDQFDVKIQVHGTTPADAEMSIVDGSWADRRFVACYRRDGIATGVLGWNMPKQTRSRRTEFADELTGLAATHH